MNDSIRIQRYQLFNFDSDQKWQNYLKDISPAPEGKLLEKRKRIWFRNNIDSEFNVFFDTDKNSTNQGTKPEAEQGNKKVSDQVKEEIYRIEGYLKLAFFIVLIIPFFQKGLAQIIGIVICLLAIIRQTGFAGLSTVFLNKIFGNDFFFNLVYEMCTWVVADQKGAVFLYPVCLHFVIGVAEFLARSPGKFGFIVKSQKFQTLLRVARDFKGVIMEAKCMVEMIIGVYLIVLWFTDESSLFNLQIYLAFLVAKAFGNETMKKVVLKLKNKVLSLRS